MDSREPRRERWTEDLSLDLGAGVILGGRTLALDASNVMVEEAAALAGRSPADEI